MWQMPKSGEVKRILAYVLLLGCGAAYLWSFVLICVYGTYLVAEGNPYMLYSEVCFFALVTIFAVERIVNGVIRGKDKRD